MRRPSSVLLLCTLALASLGFASVAPAAPAAPATVAPAAATVADAGQIVICVRFRDWGVPGTGITLEKPAEQLCVELPDVNPDLLPAREDRA